MNLAELARRLQPYLYPPGSGGGGGGVAPINASYVVMAANAILTNERIVTQGNGMTLTDGGAGGPLVVALATPGTLTVATTNAAVVGSHTHAITSSSNPGAAAAILATNSSGALSLSTTASVDTLTVVATHSAARSLYAIAAGGTAVNAEATTGIAADFLRTGIGTAPALKVRSTSASDAQALIQLTHAGTGDFITAGAGAYVLLHDGFQTSPGRKFTGTQFDKVTATLGNVTGLSVTLRASRSYAFRAVLYVDADLTGGFKFAMAGTATANAVIYHVSVIRDGGTTVVLSSRQTALGGAASGTATSTAVLAVIEGFITTSGAGTLVVQFSQSTANGTSSVLVGSNLDVRDVT